MIVGEVLLEHPSEGLLVQDKDVPQTLLAESAYNPLHVAVALGLAPGDLDRANAAVGSASFEDLPIERITIPNQEPRPLLPSSRCCHIQNVA